MVSGFLFKWHTYILRSQVASVLVASVLLGRTTAILSQEV